MIMPCKVCQGIGSINTASAMATRTHLEVCPTCRGAGEFEINMQENEFTSCKYCNGTGIVRDKPALSYKSINKICQACEGYGILKRPQIGNSTSYSRPTGNPLLSANASSMGYDITISFAGEDRAVAEDYAQQLVNKGIKVFYDRYEVSTLWGVNLYDKLDDIYRSKATFCVIFISKNYAQKLWANHERQSAQARAFMENREYILPVKLDDTEIHGIPNTIGYIDLRDMRIEELVDLSIAKVHQVK